MQLGNISSILVVWILFAVVLENIHQNYRDGGYPCDSDDYPSQSSLAGEDNNNQYAEEPCNQFHVALLISRFETTHLYSIIKIDDVK